MKSAYLITMLFAIFAISAMIMTDDSVAEPENEHFYIANMTLSEIFEYFKPLYFPGLCLSVSVFFFYKIIRYSFFDEPKERKRSR